MRGKLILIKLLFVPIFALGVVGFSQSTFALEDVDSDSVSDIVEQSAPNIGDNNFDSVADYEQNQVASVPNPNDDNAPNSYVTLQVGDPNSESFQDHAWKIDEFKPVDTATLPTQPEGKVFPLGMFDIQLSCQQRNLRFIEQENGVGSCVEYSFVETEEGCELVETPIPANLTLIFDRVMDTSNWTTIKFDPLTNSYIDYSSNVTIEAENTEFGYARTVVKWSIFDGGVGDDDGIVNGMISDPIGPSVPVATTTSVTTNVASTVRPATLAHTGNNLALYSIILGFLMVGSGLAIVRKN